MDAGLDWHALQLLVLGAGPGSFTGLRVTAAIMAGINAGHGLPLHAISSLAITARQSGSEAPVWVLEDARSGDAYIGRFQAGRALQGDCRRSWNDIRRMPPATYIALTEPPVEMHGWRRLPSVQQRPEALAEMVRKRLWKADRRGRNGRYPAPAYLHPSQAERNAL